MALLKPHNTLKNAALHLIPCHSVTHMQRFLYEGCHAKETKILAMKNLSIYIIVAFTGVLMLSCSKQMSPAKDSIRTITLPAEGPQVVTSNNLFAFDFFKATLENDPTQKNKLISPLCIYMALSMVYNGADHATRDSIAKTLKLSGISIDELNEVCAALISQLPEEDSRVQMDIANSIWYRNNSIQPLSTFLNTLKNDYNASIKALDFNNPSSVTTINNWVTEKTKNKIQSIIDQISPNDLMFLVNAIYFNGKWQQEFKPALTQKDIFHRADGSTVSVPFMNGEMKLKTSDAASFTLAELPYGSDNGFAMMVLKPKNGVKDLHGFISGLNENDVITAMQNLRAANIKLSIPKWEYAYEIKNMQPELSQLGMGIAFTGAADFTRMYDTEPGIVRISKAIHKTYIKVDEKGTEAAAVTSIGMEMTSVIIPQQLKLDRPFVYLIVEKQTGAILFLGTVNDPSES